MATRSDPVPGRHQGFPAGRPTFARVRPFATSSRPGRRRRSMSVMTGSPTLNRVPGQGTSAMDRTVNEPCFPLCSATISGATSGRGACRIHFAITRPGWPIEFPRLLAWRWNSLTGPAMVGKERPRRGELENFDRGGVAGVDLNGPGNAVANDEVNAKPAGEVELVREGITDGVEPGPERPCRRDGPDASPVTERRARYAGQLPASPIRRAVVCASRPRSPGDEEGRKAGAGDEFLEVIRCGIAVVFVRSGARYRDHLRGEWLSKPGSVARQATGIEADLGAGDAVSSQHPGDLEGVADGAERGGLMPQSGCRREIRSTRSGWFSNPPV